MRGDGVVTLVTGAAGFIGSSLVDRLLAAGERVRGVDAFTAYYDPSQKRANLGTAFASPRFEFVEADLATADLAPLLEGVDLVYHQAAQPGVRASWGAEFDGYLRNNVAVTQRLLEALKGVSLRKFVYASSSSVYGDAVALPMKESQLPRPFSPYGVTKLAAEHLAVLYHRNFGVPTVSLRYFTVVGPRQRPDMAFHRFSRALVEGRPLTVFGDGDQTRDFTAIQDAVEANLLAASRGTPGGVYNVGGGGSLSLKNGIAILEEALGRKASIDFRPRERGDPRDTSADISSAARDLGYAPRVPVADALRAEALWVAELVSKRGA